MVAAFGGGIVVIAGMAVIMIIGVGIAIMAMAVVVIVVFFFFFLLAFLPVLRVHVVLRFLLLRNLHPVVFSLFSFIPRTSLRPFIEPRAPVKGLR
jgi:hypothetical protein